MGNTNQPLRKKSEKLKKGTKTSPTAFNHFELPNLPSPVGEGQSPSQEKPRRHRKKRSREKSIDRTQVVEEDDKTLESVSKNKDLNEQQSPVGNGKTNEIVAKTTEANWLSLKKEKEEETMFERVNAKARPARSRKSSKHRARKTELEEISPPLVSFTEDDAEDNGTNTGTRSSTDGAITDTEKTEIEQAPTAVASPRPTEPDNKVGGDDPPTAIRGFPKLLPKTPPGAMREEDPPTAVRGFPKPPPKTPPGATPEDDPPTAVRGYPMMPRKPPPDVMPEDDIRPIQAFNPTQPPAK